MTVRLYALAGDRDTAALSAASEKETFAILTEAEAQAKAALLLAEGQTDAEGAFSIALPECYDGGPLEVDVFSERPRRGKPTRHGVSELQFSITTLQPDWVRTKEEATAEWSHRRVELLRRPAVLVRGAAPLWAVDHLRSSAHVRRLDADPRRDGAGL